MGGEKGNKMNKYITQKQINETIEWNRARGTMDAMWSLAREVHMLSEEANEYYIADNFIDRMDAFLDFVFVAVGTDAKFFGRIIKDSYLPVVDLEDEQLFTYIQQVAKRLYNGLKQEYSELSCRAMGKRPFEDTVKDCYEFVVAANNLKGTEKDENGKVIKSDNFVSPEDAMKKYFGEVGITL